MLFIQIEITLHTAGKINLQMDDFQSCRQIKFGARNDGKVNLVSIIFPVDTRWDETLLACLRRSNLCNTGRCNSSDLSEPQSSNL